MAYLKVIGALLLFSFTVCGCVPPEVDWRNRRAMLEMRPSELPGVVGSLTVVGNVDAFTFTKDHLWIVIAAPTKRDPPVNRLARIDLHTNRFIDLYAVEGFKDAALASGYDSIWLAEGLGGKKLHRIDPATDQIVASIELPLNPVAVATGLGGVWVIAVERVKKWGPILLGFDHWAVFKIDPKTNTISNVIRLPLEVNPTVLNSGCRIEIVEGLLWVSFSDGSIFRVDPQSNKVLTELANPQGAIPGEATYRRLLSEENKLKERAAATLDGPVYAVASGMGTFWAFTHGSKDSGHPRITWVVRLHPPTDNSNSAPRALTDTEQRLNK